MAEDTTESEEKPKLTFSKYGDEARRNDFELFLPRPKKCEKAIFDTSVITRPENAFFSKFLQDTLHFY